MQMYKILFKIFRRDQESIKSINRSKTKKILINIIACLAIVAAFVAILSPLIINSDEIKAVIPLNIGNLFLMIGFYLGFFLSLLSAFGFLFSSGYLDKNLNNYITLPIKRRDFIAGKISLVYYNVIQIILLLMVPCTIIYIIFGNVSFHGILSIILYTFTIPILAIYIVATLVGTLMYFVNKVKNKALAKNVLYFLFFAIPFSIYMYFVLGISGGGDGEDITQTIQTAMVWMDRLDKLLFYPGWATDLLNNANYLSALFMVVVIAVGVVSLLYFEKVYFKGAVGFNEGGSSGKNKVLKNAKTSNHSMTTWFFLREFKELTKTGTYFMNSFFSNILIVVIYLAMMGYSYFTQPDLGPEIRGLINDHLNIEIAILVTLAIGTFFTIFNMGAATVFSRDAKVIDFINSLPLNQSRAFFGKVLLHALVEFLTLFIFMIIPMIFLGISPIYMIVSITVMILIVLATNLIPVIVDLNFPTLDWESETQVIKRARSIIISLIIHVLLNGIVFGSAALSLIYLDIDYKIISYLGLAFYVIMFIVLGFVYRSSVTRAFRKVRK